MHVFSSMIFGVLTIALLTYPWLQHKFDSALLMPSFIISAIATFGVCISLLFSFKNKLKKALMLIIASMILFNLAVLTVVPVFDQKTSKPLVDAVLKELPKDAIFVSYQDYWEDLPVLLKQNIYLVYNWKNNQFSSDNWSREFHFGIKQYQKTHQGKWPEYLITPNDFNTLINSNKPVVIFAKKNKLNQIRQQFPNQKFIQKAQYRDVVVALKMIKM